MFGERFRRKMRDSIQFSKRLKGEPIVEAENLKQEIMSNKKIKIDKILIKYNKKIKAQYPLIKDIVLLTKSVVDLFCFNGSLFTKVCNSVRD